MKYQCYYQTNIEDPKTRCEKYQENHWCSPLHEKLWKAKNYPPERRQPTMDEMRARLRKMQIDARLKAMTNKDGQRKIF